MTDIREGLKGFVAGITDGGEYGDELRAEDWNGSWADAILTYLRENKEAVQEMLTLTKELDATETPPNEL